MNLGHLHSRWEKLVYWQKGAILGSAFHLSAVLLIVIATILFVPTSSPSGSGDMGPLRVWILYAIYVLAEMIPLSILYLFTGIDLSLAGVDLKLFDLLYAYSDPQKIWIWGLYMTYATAVYALIGIAVAKIINSWKAKVRRKDDYQNP